MYSGFFSSGKESIYFENMEIDGAICRTIVLHGAGSSDSSRTHTLREDLYRLGVPTLAIDFSGHGQSSHYYPCSIEKRIQESSGAIGEYLDTQDSLTLIGLSMSGEVCIRLAQQFDVKNLILLCPGIYHRDAISLNFGEDFSALIRSHESWRENDIGFFLRDFTGNILLFTAEFDTVIPEGVNEIIMHSAPYAQKERIIVKGAPHMIGKWMNEYPKEAEKIEKKIAKTIL